MTQSNTRRSQQVGRSTSGADSLYDALDWVMIRAPLLPVETYRALSGQVTEDDAPGNPWIFEGDSLVPRDPRVRRALAVGSGDLLDALERCGSDGRDASRLRGKLLRYLIRMSTRPTPYGLFAGVALAQWGPTTDLALGQENPRTRTRPDMEWLLSFVLTLEAQPEIRKELCFFANPLAFVHAGRVFLGEQAPSGDTTGSGAAVSVRATGVVRRALALARTPIPHDQLVAELLSTHGATPDKVEGLITRLWEQTVLLTDLRPPLTVASPARYVAQRLDGIPTAKDALVGLERLLDEMAAWDTLPPQDGAAAYRDLVTLANDVHGSAPSKTTVQVDMALALDGHQISEAVAREAVRAGELLLRLTPLPRGLPHLDAYRRAFESRYGPDREVRLVELLDPNFGLGPPSHHGQAGLAAGIDPHKHGLRQQTLRDLAIGALRERRLTVELDEETIARLESWSPDPATAPVSLDISVFVLAPSAAAVDAGEFQVVIGPNLGATTAGRNLGRFADLLTPEAEEALRRAARAEAAHAPDRLWAELSYLPRRFRSANVVIRPLVRDHEIILGATPAERSRRVIPLDELVVAIRDGRLSVRWQVADAEVVACAGHMLNTFQAPEACRFLDDLRHDGVAQLNSFDWGPAAGLPFLPRVQTGRIVLSPAQWRIDRHTRVSGLPSDTPKSFQRTLRDWRAHWQVPRHVYLSAGDNRLLLDLEDAAQADELRAEACRLQEGAYLVLQEALPAPDQAWAQGPGGHYITEFVVPLMLRGTRTRDSKGSPAQPPRIPAASSSSRYRPPGSDWSFVKLYCPRIFQDDLITGPVPDFCEYVRSSGLVQEWFFIRYFDPEFHLRLRFHGRPERLVGELIPQMCDWATGLIADGLCSRFCFDTYERELERYGGAAGTTAAEALFAADSRAVVELLKLSQQGESEIDRTTLAVLSIDDLLAGIGLAEAERLQWYRDRVISKQQSGPEYRQRQATLRALLGVPEQLCREPGGAAIARIFAARRQALASVRQRLDALAEAEELGQPIRALCRSFVHLHCNRLLGAGWPTEEQALGLLLRTREGVDRAPVQPTASTSKRLLNESI